MLKAAGKFLAYWVGFTFLFTIISLVMSGFAALDTVVGVSFLATVGWLLIDRYFGKRNR